MQKLAEGLTSAQFVEWMAADIEARRKGGPDLQAKYLGLVEQLPKEIRKEYRERTIELWTKVNGERKPQKFERREFSDEQIKRWQAERGSFFGSAAQPKADPEPEDTPEEEPEEEPKAEPEPRAALPAVIPPQPPPATWDDLLTVMNNQHAIIDNVGGKAVIASWEPSPLDPSRRKVVFQNKESFSLRYSNRYATIEITTKRGATVQVETPLSTWWLTHRNRRQYRGITFWPGKDKVVNECLNLWRGWGCEAREGDWSLIRDHIEIVLAGENAEFAVYLIRWIAWSIQNPGAQAEVALVLIGAKGSGKGTLVRLLERIFGQHCFQVSSREEVIGKFNGHLQDCILFVADEAYWGGDKRCVGRLQAMITEPKLTIERKGIDAFEVRNLLHMLMLAEPGWVIPAGRYERRYAAFAVSTVKRGDRPYFRALHHQIQNGGAEAMFYDLQRMDLGDWHPRNIPEALLTNPALQKQQSYNLPPLEQWYLTLLHNGTLPHAKEKTPYVAMTRALVESAKQRVPRLRELSDVALRNFLTDQEAIGVVVKKHRTSSANGWEFPLLSECREAWSKLYGPTEWDTDMLDWGEPVEEAQPKAKAQPKPPAKAAPANVSVIAAEWRRF
jgi:hypothetical protein